MPVLSVQKQIMGMVGWLAVCYCASAIGAVASIQAKSFYAELVQPGWSPPAWVFGPVWTTLYTMMGVAAWLVWRSGGFSKNRNALMLFLIQLAFNSLWSWLFFAWHLGAWAFADILLLLTLIAATSYTFWLIQPLAGALLVPYFLWVCFATVLSYNLWQHNPHILG